MTRRGFDESAFPVVVAHRGASTTRPENTLDAFEAALELGVPVVELDVRLTADGVAVVIHDGDVARTTDGTGLVHEMTFEQVRALNAGTMHHPAEVPSLAEALGLISGRAAAALEIKNLPGEASFEAERESIVEATVADIERVGFDGPVLMLSFNPRSIAAARELAPDIVTGFLAADAIAPADALGVARTGEHAFVLASARGLLSRGFDEVEAAHAAGVRFGTWTVDRADAFRALLDAGVDAVATSDPAMGLETVAAWRASGSGAP